MIYLKHIYFHTLCSRENCCCQNLQDQQYFSWLPTFNKDKLNGTKNCFNYWHSALSYVSPVLSILTPVVKQHTNTHTTLTLLLSYTADIFPETPVFVFSGVSLPSQHKSGTVTQTCQISLIISKNVPVDLLLQSNGCYTSKVQKSLHQRNQQNSFWSSQSMWHVEKVQRNIPSLTVHIKTPGIHQGCSEDYLSNPWKHLGQ